MKYIYLVLAILGVSIPTSEADESRSPEERAYFAQLAAIELTDTHAKAHSPFADNATKAVVLLFVSNDCPIANAFQPTLQSLFHQYQSQGIACFMVYSSVGVLREQIETHVAAYKIEMPPIRDADQKLAKLVKAKFTPEAIVLDRKGEIRYRGQISNLYVGYGKKRQSATEHYLQAALQALVDDKAIATPETKPLGCFIHYEEPSNQATNR